MKTTITSNHWLSRTNHFFWHYLLLVVLVLSSSNITAGSYCTPLPSANGSNTMWISSVTTTGGLTNFKNTSVNESACFADYSATKSTSHVEGGTVTMTFSSGGYALNYAVWIDYNDNGVFTDLTENVILGSKNPSTDPALPFTASFTVPLGAKVGSHRMRIRGDYQAMGVPTLPCSTLNFGETEDYTFTVAANVLGVSGISPASGPMTGGTSVVINGTKLTGASAVKFGTTNATSFTVNSAMQITATAPAGSVGTVDVTVTTSEGTSATGTSDKYSYLGPPTFTSTPSVTTVDYGTPYFYNATATKLGDLATTMTATTLPAWMTFNPGGQSTATLIGNISYGQSIIGVTGDSNGNIYAINGNGIIFKILPDGTTSTWKSGLISGTSYALHICDGYIYIPRYSNSVNSLTRIPLNNPAAAEETVIAVAGGISSINDKGDYIYAAAYNNNQILKIDKKTKVSTVLLSNTDGIVNPWGLTFDATGNLYIAESTPNGDGPLIKYDGTTITVVLAGLKSLTSVRTDIDGNFYISSVALGVRKYKPDFSSYVVVSPLATDPVFSLSFTASGSLLYAYYSSTKIYKLQIGAILYGTPAISNVGVRPVALRATNTAGSANQSFNVTVVAPAVTTSSNSLTDNTDVTISNRETLIVEAAKTLNSVTVQPGGTLDLTKKLTVNGNITLKADDNGSFSAKIPVAVSGSENVVSGTVRYVKTVTKGKWYFISFPCDVAQADITDANTGLSLGTFGDGAFDWDVEYYDGLGRSQFRKTDASNWISIGSDNPLIAYKGYIFTVNGTGTVDVAFKLANSLVQSENIGSIPASKYQYAETSNVQHDGWNLVGQPYLSKYAGGDAATNYMTFPNADGGLTYTSVEKTTGRVVDPFTAYFVQVSSSNSISFPKVIHKSARSLVTVDLTDRVQLNFTSTTGTDNTNLIMDNAQSTAYQIGEDMMKWLGTGTPRPQVYSLLGGVSYAFNALPMASVVNLSIGIYTQTAGSTTISADASAPSLSKLLLTDNTTGTVTDLLTSNYSFNATAGTTNTRFAITAQRVPTENVVETDTNSPTIIGVNGKLSLSNLVGNNTIRVYDAIGRMIISKETSNTSMEMQVPIPGMYTIQIISGTKSWTKKVIL